MNPLRLFALRGFAHRVGPGDFVERPDHSNDHERNQNSQVAVIYRFMRLSHNVSKPLRVMFRLENRL
jgi:hypothetical protein